MKVHEGLARGDYKDPRWDGNFPGTVAYKADVKTAAAARNSAAAARVATTRASRDGRMMAMEVRARRTIGMQAVVPLADPAARPTPRPPFGTLRR